MTSKQEQALRDALIEIVTDKELLDCFSGTNFGKASPREIVTDTLLKISGGFSTGHTAIVCCQELGLLGKNKRDPRLTKKGKHYFYYAMKASTPDPSLLDAIREARDKLVCSQMSGFHGDRCRLVDEALTTLNAILGD